MQEFKREVQVRWSDLDPNFHLRHSVYYDWGAFCRIQFFNETNLTDENLKKAGFGPIIFREECVFRKEIKMADIITIDLQLTKARKDFSRWSIYHQIKKGDTIAALLTVDGAWLDLKERKLTTPSEKAKEIFELMPKSENFEWT